MKELVDTIVKGLVSRPEEVEVSERKREDATIVELRVAKEDMGKVIGKRGRIARSIRTIVKAASSQGHRRYILEIVDE